MTWVKQNYDRFMLALAAAALLACAVLLFNNVRGYNEIFDSLKGKVTQKRTLPVSLNTEKVTADQQKLDKPDQWEARMLSKSRRLPVFVSVPYIAKSDVNPQTQETKNALFDPYADDPAGILHRPVPNAWLLDHGQDILSGNVLDQDTDSDGFTTLDEYIGTGTVEKPVSTDPQDAKSHPAYYSKLVLTKFVRIPFRLLYEAGTGPFQINTLDLDQPTQFLKLNDPVKGTKFKITKFEAKTKKEGGMTKDVSELTLVNTETNEPIVLPKQTEVDSPTTYAVLTYLWTGKPFAVKKNQEFTLKPEDNVKYKCVDLSDKEVKVIKEDENKELHIKIQAR